MISCFPVIYPDELIYSLTARYFVKSGYMAYTFVAQDLFTSKTVRPDIEFINEYTTDALRLITRDMPMKIIIEKHTMFPSYGRFLNHDGREKAFDALISMQGNYSNLLPMPKSKNSEKRYLRYCPICANNDRKKYGETYWHRIHQIKGVNICPIHYCLLKDSKVLISGKASPALITAEEVIAENSVRPIPCKNEIECKAAKYAADVFQSEIDLQSYVTVGSFLHSRMENTEYRSVRGKQRNIGLFHKNFTQYYKELPDNSLSELWQIQKVLTSDRTNFYEICLLAMFLNIPVPDLVRMELPEKSQQQIFDEQIFQLHEQGLKYTEIARHLNAPYDTVKAIGEKKYRKHSKEIKKPLRCGAKSKNWEQIDDATLPLVKKAIKSLHGDGISKPKKVTVFAVEKKLGLPSKRISTYLPKCRMEIEKNRETQEQYWAREVVWAVHQVKKKGEILIWRKVRDLTNLRRRDFEVCLPYIDEMVDVELAERIKGLL